MVVCAFGKVEGLGSSPSALLLFFSLFSPFLFLVLFGHGPCLVGPSLFLFFPHLSILLPPFFSIFIFVLFVLCLFYLFYFKILKMTKRECLLKYFIKKTKYYYIRILIICWLVFKMLVKYLLSMLRIN